MTDHSSHNHSRRAALMKLSATGLGLLAGKTFAQDRPMKQAGFSTVCDNNGVLTSDMSIRVATVKDFGAASSCQLSQNSVEGPYFICADTMNARKIAEGVDGERMLLALRVTDQTCTPIPGAIVDVWQCDARGVYSGHAVDPDKPIIPGPGRRVPDADTRFLRGVLATDADGIAEFDAIYPGYYSGRAIHTHYKVHVGDQSFLTSQALYPEEWNDKVFSNSLYSENRGTKRILNANDFFGSSGGLFTIFERGGQLIALINLTVKT